MIMYKYEQMLKQLPYFDQDHVQACSEMNGALAHLNAHIVWNAVMGQRRRRWTNIGPALSRCLVIAGFLHDVVLWAIHACIYG